MKYEFGKKTEPLKKFCLENRTTVGLICAAALLLSMFQLINIYRQSGSYIKDGNGHLRAVRIEDSEEGNTIPLRIEAFKDGVKTKVDVILSFGGKEAGGEVKEKKGQNSEERLRSQVLKLSRSLESETGELIALPGRLDDGTRLLWRENRSSSVPAMIMLVPLSVAALYQNSKAKEKEKVKQKNDGIRRDLPGFHSQLLLLLNSGLIFNDAFFRIAEGYEKRVSPGYLGTVILDIKKYSAETGISLIALMEQYGKKLGVREFSRMTGIIADNQYKGIDLTEKLESESDLLWNQRKKLAEERGRAAETKLAFPLAMLLMVLIVITAAPAVLQM